MSTVITKPTWHVDGWSGNMIDDAGVDWFVHADSGWFDTLSVRLDDQDKSGGHGTYSGPSFDSSRVITLTGHAKAPDAATAESARNQLNALCRHGHLHQLLVEEPVVDKVAWVKRGGGQLRMHSPRAFDFQVILIAPDPLKYAAALSSGTTGLAADAPGGVLWDGAAGSTGVQWGGPAGATGMLWQTGVGETGVITLTNTGTAATSMVFTITGPVTAPSILDLGSGAGLVYSGDVGTGQTLVIDTKTGSVRLDGADRSYLLSRADLVTIPALSETQVAFRSPIASPTAQLGAVWRDAWA